ncbi:MAG: glycosyltransferase [Candidatus Gastranaerophilales bacterium]|nr:glycosyltransferase [Candidatus Gastranaerophilales bacterium]
MTQVLLKNNLKKLSTDNITVSVVIPTHKPDMKYFLRCFNSVKNQTFGFNNIEVIIVVHNTNEQFFNEIKDLVKDYDNVKLLKLDNNKRSASSPRNYGMKFVTNKYVTFLDDDDALKENFIVDSLNYIKNHNVQFVSYARKNIRDDHNIVSIKYNELETRINKEIIYNINKNAKIIPFEQAVFVTGKMFDFDFIKKHHIEFNEDIPVFEDFLFVSQVLKHSKFVCVQPHILGYYYHLNEDSIVNNLNRTDADVLNCVNGILNVIETIKSSPYLSKIGLRELIAYIGVTMFSSVNISYLTRCKVRDLMQKYIKLLWSDDDNSMYAKNRSKLNYKIMETEITCPAFAFVKSKILKLLRINPMLLVSFFTKTFD